MVDGLDGVVGRYGDDGTANGDAIVCGIDGVDTGHGQQPVIVSVKVVLPTRLGGFIGFVKFVTGYEAAMVF